MKKTLARLNKGHSRKKSSLSSSSLSIEPLLFGAPLPRDVDEVPTFVESAIQFLEENALEEEGIFRVPGDNNVMQQTREDLNAGKPFDMEDIGRNVNTVASLLKMYFRQLPEPLLTFDHYDMFIAAEGVPDPETRLNCIKKVLQFIPPANMRLLRMLCRFLHAVAERQHINKMSTQNLAIVFAPNLLKPNSENPMDFARDSPYSLGLMQTLIEQCEFMFETQEMIETPQELQRRRLMQRKEEQLREEEEKVEHEQQQHQQQQLNMHQHHQQQQQQHSDDDDSDFEFDIEGASTPAEAAERIKRLSVRLTSGKPVPPPRKPSMLTSSSATTTTASPLSAPAPPPRANRPSMFGNGNQMIQNSSPITRKVSTVLPPPASRSMFGMSTENERAPIRKPPPPLPERSRRSTVANIPSKPVTKTIHARCSPMNRPSFHGNNGRSSKRDDGDDETWTFGRDATTTTAAAAQPPSLPKRKPPPPLPARVRPPPPPLPSRQ